jgi:hypothetical protein
MALQYSTTLRNNQLDQIESTVGATAHLRLYSGSPPADCATAPTGTMLLDITLPADWMNAASGGTKTKLGTWQGTGDAGAGTGTNAGYFRLWDSGITNCAMQGTVTVTGGGGDLTIDNTNIAAAQVVTVSTFTVTAGNP